MLDIYLSDGDFNARCLQQEGWYKGLGEDRQEKIIFLHQIDTYTLARYFLFAFLIAYHVFCQKF